MVVNCIGERGFCLERETEREIRDRERRGEEGGKKRERKTSSLVKNQSIPSILKKENSSGTNPGQVNASSQ